MIRLAGKPVFQNGTFHQSKFIHALTSIFFTQYNTGHQTQEVMRRDSDNTACSIGQPGDQTHDPLLRTEMPISLLFIHTKPVLSVPRLHSLEWNLHFARIRYQHRYSGMIYVISLRMIHPTLAILVLLLHKMMPVILLFLWE